MADFTPQIALGTAVAFCALVFSAVFRILILQSKRDEEWQRIHDEDEADKQWCGQHRAVLITACQQNGVDIPPIVWEMRPALSGKTKGSKRARS